MPNGLSSVLWFCAIVALIPVTLWFLKRTPLGGGSAAGVLKTVANLSLSTSQRIVTIEVGNGDERRWLVLGVTPNSITPLHTMTPDDGTTPSDPAPLHPAFAQILGRLRRPGAGGPGAR
jgi:flagellar protein FliO/FliZ